MKTQVNRAATPTAEASLSITTNTSPYLELITQHAQGGDLVSPTTAEEATHRIVAAQEQYEALAPPVVDMPDTPPRTLERILDDRQRQYWIDRGEVRSGSMKQVDVFMGIDSSPSTNALRLAAGTLEEVPGEVLLWGVAKATLAGTVLKETKLANGFIETGELDPDFIIDEEHLKELGAISRGEARIEIHDGAPVLVPQSYATLAKELSEAIHARHMSWQERHALMQRSSKLRVVMPLLRDALSSARSVDAFANLVMFHYGEYHRSN